MGDASEFAADYEKHLHTVCLNDFHIGKYEVTVEEFSDFIADTHYKTDAEKSGGCLFWVGTGWIKGLTLVWNRPGFAQTARHPVTCVSWNDAQAYVRWKREKTGQPYRLPTEAEWEYAARGGVKRKRLNEPSTASQLNEVAWYRNNAKGKPHPVGQKRANALGLYDMRGNLWEWVQDAYSGNYYRQSIKDNPKGPVSGKGKVVRGGSWYLAENAMRIGHRNWSYRFKRYNSFGFRLVL